MLNWIKAFGIVLVLVALTVGVLALLKHVTQHFGPGIILALLATMLLGFFTWAMHDRLYRTTGLSGAEGVGGVLAKTRFGLSGR